MKNFARISLTAGAFVLVAGSAFALGSKVFPDVQKGSYYEEAVNNLSAAGVISGYPNGNFGPANTVNRADLATILDRYDQKVVLPLRWQLMLFNKKGVADLKGQPWTAYQKEYAYYPLEESGGREGGPNYDSGTDYINSVPEGWTKAYSDNNSQSGIDIIAEAGYKTDSSPSYFYILAHNDFLGDSVDGFFYDDVNRIVSEAKSQ